jgi:predicted DNA-binding transcriptional regulator YafY
MNPAKRSSPNPSEIQPLLIFQSEGYYRILARHDHSFKQYHLNKLIKVTLTDRKFKRVPKEEIDELFAGSFRSWIGTERHTVKIQFSKIWAERLKPRQLMESQVVTENPDGSVVYEMVVNSLTEIASWVASRGEGVNVLEPQELREMVVEIARGTLGNY